MRLAILTLGVVGACVLATPAAQAQRGERWLLLAAAPETAPDVPERLTQRLGRELRARGAYVVAFDEARALFEARHSADPAPADASDLDVVAKEARAALLHVATGRNERARRSVTRVLERAERALESLNRETDAARNVLNACLYLVRAMMESGNEDAARAHVLECRRLVPDIEPDPHDHPPRVLQLLHDAELRMMTAGTGTLKVESTPPQCALYVNGRALGETPFELRRLPPGEYRVQAECPGHDAARVHRVVLAAEPTRLHIDARFDTAVRSRPSLALGYPTAHAARAHRLGDAVAVARVLDTPTAVLLTPGRDALRLDRVDAGEARVVASVRLPVAAAARRKRLDEAVAALWEGRSVDLTGPEPQAIDPWRAPERPQARREARSVPEVPAGPTPDASASRDPGSAETTGLPETTRRAVGWSLLGAGAAGLAAGWVLWPVLAHRADALGEVLPEQSGFLERQAEYDRMRVGTAVSSALGGAMATASLPLILPETDGVPWWGWASGAVGAGLVAWGVVPLVAGDAPGLLDRRCVDAGCTRREPTGVLGGMLVAHGAPLLAVPITQLVRRALGPGTDVRARVGPGETFVTLRGVF